MSSMKIVHEQANLQKDVFLTNKFFIPNHEQREEAFCSFSQESNQMNSKLNCIKRPNHKKTFSHKYLFLNKLGLVNSIRAWSSDQYQCQQCKRNNLETVQDFLIKLGIKQLMHLLEISIFSLKK